MSYTLKNLQDVEDKAVAFGMSDIQVARFPAEELGAQATAFGHHIIHPGKRQAFGHRHEAAEEVYVILGGSGRVKLDDEIVELRRLDALRVAPAVTRQFEAGADGLELLVFGPWHKGDGEVLPGWWSEG